MGKRHSHLHRHTTSMMSLVNSKIKVMQCRGHQTAGDQMLYRQANQAKSAVALAEIIARQDMPAGLFNLVMGPGGAIGQGLVESPAVNAISFVTAILILRLPPRLVGLLAVPGKNAQHHQDWLCMPKCMMRLLTNRPLVMRSKTAPKLAQLSARHSFMKI